MRVCDLTEDQIRPGLRFMGLKSDVWATVVFVDYDDDNYAWYIWDHENFAGFYGTDCLAEVGESPTYVEPVELKPWTKGPDWQHVLLPPP